MTGQNRVDIRVLLQALSHQWSDETVRVAMRRLERCVGEHDKEDTSQAETEAEA